MKSRVLLPASFLLLLFAAPILLAQKWTNLPGPYGRIDRMVSDGSTLYASSSYDVLFRSTDDGANWARVDSLPGYAFFAPTFHGDTLYTISGTLAYSVDGAKTWTKRGSDVIGSSLVFKDPYIFVGSGRGATSQEWDGKVFRSSDHGATWELKMMGMSRANVLSMAVLGEYVFALTHEFGKGVWRTSDNGESWKEMKGVGGYLAALHVEGPRIYAIGQSTVFVSLDSGATWEKRGLGIYGSVKSMAASGDTLIVGTSENVGGGGSLFRSTDQGLNFKKFADGVSTTEFYTVVRHRNQVFAGSLRGIYRTTFGGTGWEQRSDGVTNLSIHALGFNDGTMYAAGDRGLYSSPDLGRTWVRDDNGLEEQSVHALFSNGSRMLVGGEKGIYSRGVVGGWNRATMTGLNGSNTVVRAFSPAGDVVYAAVSGGLLRSNGQGGGPWTVVASFPVKYASALASQGTDMFVLAGSVLYRSTDAGENWTKLKDFGGSSIRSIAVNGQDIYAMGSFGRYRSSDYGDTWGETGFEGLTYYGKSPYVVTLVGSTVYTGTEDGIFRSTDKGSTWAKSDSVLDGIRVVALVPGPNQLYAATEGAGIFRSGEVSGVAAPGRPAEAGIPVRVYPNPFVNETTIEFTLACTNNVSIDLLDMLGRVVWTNGEGVYGGGEHCIKINKRDLKAGMYLYRLRLKEGCQLGRLMVR